MNFLQRIKDGAGKVTDRAQNAVEIGRLNTQISNIEREMGLYFQRMGEVFYEGYSRKDMSNAEKEMVELAKTCDLLSEERDEIRSKIAELKNERLCGACGKAITEDALFCQYCGHKLERSKPAAAADRVKEPDHEPVPTQEPVKEVKPLTDPLALFEGPANDDTIIYREPKAQPVDEEQEARHQRELERERERQEELDRRIRTWKEDVVPRDQVSSTLESAVPTTSCQICSAILVKGTKWCPHCGSEQI
ncbi:hypothetical protein DFP94_1132 [Fontibacillus phaseoli]|uniref:Zinc-ribbon domain-containing protein n=1 Tax=Fontibacillus phaseoli TaxID=1416533 RepID=A0A369B6H4_9BACL|nr:zinc ribbon domain-containing protein [Fontibacillus phaseoli]RCX16146.1 hypothetical protein DFP94_1132 [Fontibacillus phaseoli]